MDFFVFAMLHYPKCVISLPHIAIGFIFYALRLYGKEQLKEKYFSFVKYIPDVSAAVESFWSTHIDKIQKFYLEADHENDVIISASPEFLLEHLRKVLPDFKLIASKVDPGNGRFSGINCYGDEKVKRFKAEFPDFEIVRFYSDSLSDYPLAVLATEAFLVKNDKVKEWITGN